MDRDAALKELRRELNMRLTIYPDWVNKGKLSLKTANHRVECIEWAIQAIEQLPEEEQEQGDRAQLDLFGEEVA